MTNNIFYTGDNLSILREMKDNSVDLVYLDPPFNSGRIYKGTVGSQSDGTQFSDLWGWSDFDEKEYIQKVQEHENLSQFIDLIGKIVGIEMKSYIAYMYMRIVELHRILKETGSLYLHADQTACHYLKIILDDVFGSDNFLNEVIWSYRTGGAGKKTFAKKHDVLLFYAKAGDYYFNLGKQKSYTKAKNRKVGIANYGKGKVNFLKDKKGVYNWVNCRDVWDIPYINSQAKERTGYPTQKPVALLERVIRASSKEGDVVLDPFCGSGTTCVVAQQLGRRWIGIDIEAKAADILAKRLGGESFERLVVSD